MVSTNTKSSEIQDGGHVVVASNGGSRVELVDKHFLDYHANTMALGKPFRYDNTCLVTGGDDGTLRVYKINKASKINKVPRYQEISKLETKGGPLRCLEMHNTTKFSSADLIVGDAKGTLTILCNEQILNRRTLSEGCITALAVDEDFVGNLAIVVGDNRGVVTAVSPYGNLWRLQLQDACKHTHRELGVTPSVRCILPVRLQMIGGILTNYLLISDSCQNLFVLQNGMVVNRTQVTSVVTAMTCGSFMELLPQLLSPSQAFGSPRRQSTSIARQPQVAIGTEDGSIMVFADFQLHPYASVQLPVTRLVSVPNEERQDAGDYLLCAGHFNALVVLLRQELVLRLETDDWVHTIACTEGCSRDGRLDVALGLLNNTIQTYEITL
ncbi:uncharacterized protein LOC5513026 [Nematostella vectensis]|uniref:uncharacterized protein LOC5513026 n=1 Tax=Nematostella vectensis TaxID=45351 RepID=UPI0020772C8D|nr:uncharacterized protein LOC5513026 [Nematostella vectensis]